MSEETLTKKKKGTFERYFNTEKVDDKQLEKIQLKRKNKQKIEGGFIKVAEQTSTGPNPNIRKNNKQLKSGAGLKIKKEDNETKENKPKLLTSKKIQNDIKENKDKSTQKLVAPRGSKIAPELLAKYSRADKVNSMKGIKTKFFKEKHRRKEIIKDYVVEQAARTELLLQEDEGFIQPDENEVTAKYRQSEIVANVDIQAASKHFKLKLDFGPYSMRYTKNGRELLLGGRRGHVAAMDWITKKLKCEFNVMEEVADVAWLHVNTMFAVAQKDWLRIYDTQGTELHCIKHMYRVNRIEFLPYHFLLATANSQGYLSWLDVSVGEMVANYNSRLGDVRLMRQNPGNGVLCIGGGKGVVSMWSPKVRTPLAKILCHPTPLSALAVDPKGQHLVTAGLDKTIKVWDVRKLIGPLRSYSLHLAANQVDISQRGVLAFTQNTNCEMFSNLLMGKEDNHPYLRHRAQGYVHAMQFCPYEDVLGVASSNGFESLLVPGAGEPNFDALEDNPYQTKKQRREREVHNLLEKIPAEFIALNPDEITKIDEDTLQEKIDAKRNLFFLKPPKVVFTAKKKMKGRGGTVKAARNKQIVKDLKRKEFIEKVRESKKEVIRQHAVNKDDNGFIPLEGKTKKPSVLDRFKSKTKKIA